MKKLSIPNALLWVLAGVLLVTYYNLVRADDDCRGHSCNDGGDTIVDVGGTNVEIGDTIVNGGDTNVPVNVQHSSKSKALGLSNGLGDVDIAGCLGSTQWATPLLSKQKLELNWPCLAEFYLRQGKYKLAAMAMCNTAVVKEFESEQACEEAHDFTPPPASADDREEIQVAHEQDINRIQTTQMQVMARLDGLEERLEQRPAPRPVTRVEQKPAFTQEQISAAWAALNSPAEEEDDE
jgi:hypothetical protein